MNDVALLFVTCCLEPSRTEILRHVARNLQQQAGPELLGKLTVFDNASTDPEASQLLQGFSNVWRADHNVGYWTAIDWWLRSLAGNEPRYTYVIESDMVHYGLGELLSCVSLLDRHPELGSVRLHEYSVEHCALYNKDNPSRDQSKLCQSHTNKVTSEGVWHKHLEGPFWKTNFLTQLPALNRCSAMQWCFKQLSAHSRFTELDFQRFYHVRYPEIAILDGGIFNCDLNPYGAAGVTGSWTSTEELRLLGYHSTRFASIVPPDQYTVVSVR